MGSFVSTNRLETVEAVPVKFVIPSNLVFSNDQLFQLARQGQRVGVPFEIANEGAERTIFSMKKMKKTVNYLTIDPLTVKVSTHGARLSLMFSYDALCDGLCSIYIRGRDVSPSPNDLQIIGELEYFGPYKVSLGICRM